MKRTLGLDDDEEVEEYCFVLNTTNEILKSAIQIKKFVPPWDKISNVSKPFYDIQQPRVEVGIDFVTNYESAISTLSNHTTMLFKYLLLPYLDTKPLNENEEVEEITKLKRKDFGLTKIVNNEYEYINNLKSAQFYLILSMIHNTKISSMWERYVPDRQLSIRKSVFLEFCKINTLIYCFGKKECIHRRNLGYKSENLEEHLNIIITLNLGIPIKSYLKKFTDESNSLWIQTCGERPLPQKKEPQPEKRSVVSKYLNSNSSNTTNQSTILVESPKPILLYSVFDLDESFRFLMYRLKSVNYHVELEKYINLLITRMSFILVFKDTCVEGPTYYTLEEPIKLNGYNSFSEYMFRMEVRSYYIFEKFFRFNTFRRLYETKFSDNKDLELHEKISIGLKRWCLEWSKGQMAKSIGDRIRQRYITIILPPGDLEWMKVVMPMETMTPSNVLEKLHRSVSEILTKEAGTEVSKIIEKSSASIVKLHDEIVIEAMNSFFSDEKIGDGFSFKETFFYDESREDTYLNKETIIKKPFLAILFSRIQVHFQTNLNDPRFGDLRMIRDCNLTSHDPNNSLDLQHLVLSAVSSDQTIYHSIATLLILLKNYYATSNNILYMWEQIKKLI